MLPENDRRTLVVCALLVGVALVGLLLALGVKHNSQTQLAKSTPTPAAADAAKQSAQPPFEGIDTLTDHGTSKYQLDDVKAAFDKYKNQTGGQIQSVQVDPGTVTTLPRPANTTISTLTFGGTFNNKTPYLAKVELSDITVARLMLTDAAGKPLFDSGTIDLYNNPQ
jgi:hypothetical protein